MHSFIFLQCVNKFPCFYEIAQFHTQKNRCYNNNVNGKFEKAKKINKLTGKLLNVKMAKMSLFPRQFQEMPVHSDHINNNDNSNNNSTISMTPFFSY